MDLAEDCNKFQEFLRPSTETHVPLPPNFYESFLRKNPNYNPQMETPSAPSTPNTSSNSIPSARIPSGNSNAQVVKALLETNKRYIEQAAMQKAANEVNVKTAQYNNLIPISFDQEEFLRGIEESRRPK
ncbi:Reverse transcriptase domain-containing protein [Caenorhabditis elegans]|uniref:Reverse transcriptase domain-containing protein n=1 Tax=Caenorhabditis elegans TaxID=6239 RepID=A9IHM9_CAEEL|nr:Reverse transcriptase domain-containing protein [Caenorhabditis elegans]CAP46783.1 Reverse transcriptase domain-containing protein [Caenorhabditis elegans]|eukprot:NP_001122666.1 Uncharacterized protein CELE_Y62F5A.12 [Caenorhabditis elegans]